MTNATVHMNVNDEPKAPWCGIGKSGNWSNVDEAMEICGLNFNVEAMDMKFQYADENNSDVVYYGNVPGYKSNVRSDTHQFMGLVSNTYTLVQNQYVFSMLEPFIEQGGKVTHGGITAQGLCFMIVDMGTMNVAGDEYTVNIMATNSFNGAYPASLICSPVRIICQNMYRQLMMKSDNVARFRHSLNVTGKLDAIRQAYNGFNDYKNNFNDRVNKLKDRKAKHSIEEFVELLYPHTAVDPTSSHYDRSIDRVEEKRALYINKYYNSPTNSDFGSCFALVNAYYDYVSHFTPERKTEEMYRDKRLSSLVGGTIVKPKLMSFMCE